MVDFKVARRYGWRLCGGHLTAGDGVLRFAPNALERRVGSPDWQCDLSDVAAIRRHGKVWLEVETAAGTERFRVFGAQAAVSGLQKALASNR